MNVIEIAHQAIARVGGKWKANREGSFWEIESNGFVLQAEPFLRNLPSGQIWIGLDCSISHGEFAKFANFIMAETPKSFVSLRWFQKSREVAPDQAVEALAGLMQETLSELDAEDIGRIVEDFRAHRPDKPSMAQICHLAALAWLRETSTLREYSQVFAAGGRLNFVPMIDKTMIDRALERSTDGMIGDGQ
jgi:hypothetical protein